MPGVLLGEHFFDHIGSIFAGIITDPFCGQPANFFEQIDPALFLKGIDFLIIQQFTGMQ